MDMKTWQVLLIVASVIGSHVGVAWYQETRQRDREREARLMACVDKGESALTCLEMENSRGKP